ncbi:HAD-IA family hydrolase [Streptomyces boncukensis]|uniref:HAD family phosphatase n=1 Tax=Streptomyces boncukensis TaxID=2711219 RepID=A0A6G4X046_9ACTN|nr:HAD family phosphatase [Streptomyces boncukensis]
MVFDCDGLLADSEPLWAAARAAQYTRRGLDFGPDERDALLGRQTQEIAAIMAGHFGEPGREGEIENELLADGLERLSHSVRPMPGAVALVTQAARAVPVAVASNAPRLVLDATLEAIGLAGRFDATVATDEVARPKPAPDVYLSACRHLGVEPPSTLAFEDSPVGVRSANAAGLPTVVVGATEVETTSPRVDDLTDSGLVSWVASWLGP